MKKLKVECPKCSHKFTRLGKREEGHLYFLKGKNLEMYNAKMKRRK